MKNIFYTLLFSFPFFYLNAQCIQADWILTTNGSGNDGFSGMCIDEEDNVYTIAYYYTDSITVNGEKLIGGGASNGFIAKLDSARNILWMNNIGFSNPTDDTNWFYADRIDNGPDGTVYLSGEFEGEVTIGGETIQSLSTSFPDLFFGRFSPDGTAIWLHTGRSYGEEVYGHHTVDDDGNLYTVGHYESSKLYVENDSLVNPSSLQFNDMIFIIKHDADGNLLWMQDYGAQGLTDWRHASSVEIGADGYVYLGGFLLADTYFGDSLYVMNGGYDLFVGKFDPDNGDPIWVRNIGGDKSYQTYILRDIAVDEDLNVYATGEFKGSLPWGSLDTIRSRGTDVFTACFDPQGNPVWVKKGDGLFSTETGRRIAYKNGQLVVLGYAFASRLNLETQYISDMDDMFTLLYDRQGNLIWSRGAKSENGQIYPWMVGMDSKGTIYAGGQFRAEVTIGHTTAYGQGTFSGFLTNYKETASPPTDSVVASLYNSASSDQIICGRTTRLRATSSDSDADFYWTPFDDLEGLVPLSSTPTVRPIRTTDYVLNGDIEGCLYQDTIRIEVEPISADAGIDQSICLGDTVVLQGTSNGSSIEYLWTNEMIEDTLTSTLVVLPIENQAYILQVAHDICPDVFDTLHIHVSGVENFITTESEVCEGQSIVLDTGLEDENLLFQWSPDSTLSDSQVSQPLANPTETTDYIVSVQSATMNCAATDTLRVHVRNLPDIELLSEIDICQGEDLILDAASEATLIWSNALENGSIVQPNVDTEYQVVATDAFNCKDSATLQVYVLDLPTIDLGEDITVCTSEIVSLDGGDFDQYEWSTGEMTAMITLDSTNGTQLYALQVTDENACQNSDEIMVTVETCVALSPSLDAENKIYVFPNPTRQTFFIETSNSEIDINSLRLYAANGQLIQSWSNLDFNRNKRLAIDLPSDLKGVFWLKIITKELKTNILKIVKNSW